MTLSTEQGFALFGAWGAYMRGWAVAEQGQRDEGITQIRQGIAAYRATGAALAWPYQLALLADTQEKGEQPEEGLSVVTEALMVVDKTGERMWEAELYRLKGQLTLQQLSVVSNPLSVTNPQAEAEECFQKAIDIARTQQAKSLELRATVSLARLWQQQGKKAEAYKLLSEVYNWFTEGFDTRDLQEAKALLEELHQ